MKTTLRRLLILLLPVSVITSANDFDSLFSLSLQELINLEVTTVSKRKESILDAPGVISVITAEDIKHYGATNLKDVLQRLPNFYIFDSSTFKASGTMMRAGATQHLNNHVLYLINGSPVRESQNGGLHSDINLLFPIEIIERVEVIRGPGSVLYGSNAYSGTVNVITKENQESFYGHLKSQNGSHNYGAYTATVGININEDISFHLTANTLKDTGETLNAIDENGDYGSQTPNLDGDNLFINAKAHNFTFTHLSNEFDIPATSGSFSWNNKAIFKLKRNFNDLGYQAMLTPKWQLNANLVSNQQDRIVIGPGTGGTEFESSGRVYELLITGELTKNINLISGVVEDVVEGDLKTRGGKYKTQRQAFYSQLDYQLNPEVKLTAGLQINKAENNDSDLSPRLAMVYKYNQNWTIKAMNAKAFRSPYGSELFFDAGFLLGDIQLKPETIQTNEAQILFSNDNIALNFTFYHSKAEDLIERTIVNGINTFTNDPGEVTYEGVEFEWNWQINSSLRFQGNASYQQNEDEDDVENIMFAANEMIKFGVTYNANNQYVIGVWNNYLGPANKIEDIPGNSAGVVNPDSKTVNLLSANISTDLDHLFNFTSLKDVSISLYANNILGADVWYPELGRKLVNTFPQTHTQALYATISYEF